MTSPTGLFLGKTFPFSISLVLVEVRFIRHIWLDGTASLWGKEEAMSFNRFKGARVPGSSSIVQAVACPHCPDLKELGERADHIFWD
jgi:hypothetical protein